MAAVTLNLIAKQPPQPVGLAAFAYSLPPAQITLNYVHSLPAEAPKGENCSVEINGKTTYGLAACSKVLADYFSAAGVFGKDSTESNEIVSLIDSIPPYPPTFPTATSLLSSLEQRLTLRTFLVGSGRASPSVADFAYHSALKNNIIAQGLLSKAPHTARWYNYLSQLAPIEKALNEVPAQAKVKEEKPKKKNEEAVKEDKANSTFELGLPGAIKGQVVTRLPPEPSGYLHIGHAKAAVLNQYFAKMYEGKFLIRFDDTNPSKEKAEFEQSIVEDLALLGVVADSSSYTSDYFDQLQQYCIEMIKRGKAYADDTEQEVMRDQRMNGIPSARRESTVEESLARFAEMATASDEGKRWCIRAKISFSDPNKAMRDPVIYRVNELPHHRTGTKYKIYPTYDFCCPIVDSIEGVTHALRTNEYRDRNPQYQWMLDALNLRRVEVWDFGRLAFVYTLLSKRKLKWFVEENHVKGWDDPRFPTVRGIRRRGMTIDAITQFMLLQGPSQAFLNLEWDVIWNLNKKVIDPVAPRHVALEKQNLVPVKIIGGEGKPDGKVEIKDLPKHKKNEAVGTKKTYYSETIYVEQADAASFAQDEELTLMDWGNAFVRTIKKSSDGSTIESLEMELNLSGDFKKTKKKVTWLSPPSVSGASDELTQVKLLDYDYLITKKKLEEEDSVESVLNPKTEYSVDAVADLNIRELAKGDIIQFERKGFYIVDVPFNSSSPSQAVELIFIPDGKASTIALKYQVPEVKKEGGKKAVAGGSKDKDAAAKAKKAAKTASTPETAVGLPEVAPKEAVETILRSEGKKGFEIPVKTKMFKVDSPYGSEGYEAQAETKMFKVKPVYQLD
ncbi:glutamate--tRNA ligase GUS1 [Sporobolomyces salmoneus]|uniref:glutamate--tRNA ligase GUS1 n=1 Tax=Sporobolomyces salmoneus TaxID=183962 RepID=UPI00317F43EC